VVLSTAPSPIEVDAETFAEFFNAVEVLGLKLVRRQEHTGYYMSGGCRRVKHLLPSLYVELGTFAAIIPPSEYMMPGTCFADVQASSTGVMQLNSALLRHTATWFKDRHVGICAVA
jgi:hypothetical protein